MESFVPFDLLDSDYTAARFCEPAERENQFCWNQCFFSHKATPPQSQRLSFMFSLPLRFNSQIIFIFSHIVMFLVDFPFLPFRSMLKSFSWCFFFIKSLRFSFLSNDSVLWEIDFMLSGGGFFMRIKRAHKKRKSRVHDDSSFTFDSISLLTPDSSRAEGN